MPASQGSRQSTTKWISSALIFRGNFRATMIVPRSTEPEIVVWSRAFPRSSSKNEDNIVAPSFSRAFNALSPELISFFFFFRLCRCAFTSAITLRWQKTIYLGRVLDSVSLVVPFVTYCLRDRLRNICT